MDLQCSSKKAAPGFSCTGSDESHIWKKFHDKNGNIGPLMEEFHCGTCQRHAHKLFLGLHSLVNLGIGKPLEKKEWKDNFLELVQEVNTVYAAAKGDNRI